MLSNAELARCFLIFKGGLNLIKINNVLIKSPKALSVVINDLDGESERNAAGNLIRDRIAVKRSVAIEWGPLTDAEISTILTAVGDVFFSVTYPDPQLGTTTKTFYVGNRTTPVYSKCGTGFLWENLSCTFIER